MKNKISRNLLSVCLGVIVEVFIAYTNTFQTYYLTYILAGVVYLIIGTQFRKYMISRLTTITFLLPLLIVKFFLVYANAYNYPFIFPFCFLISLFSFAIGYYLRVLSNLFLFFNAINFTLIYFFGFVKSPQIVSERYMERSNRNPTKKINKWNLKKLDGSLLPFNTIEKKVALLNFSWKNCGQCIIKQPYLEKLQEKYKNRADFIILEIDLGEYDTISEALIFSKQPPNNLKWAYDADNELANKLDYRGAPHQVIVDKKGKIINISSGFNGDLGIMYIEDTSRAIDALLNEKM